MKIERFEPHFVDHFPEQLDAGVLYVSVTFASASHLCACGCGKEVVTPLSPVAWSLTFDGENISLDPSIGNWSLPCRSHYWIEKGKVLWSYDMSEREIRAGRVLAQAARVSHYDEKPSNPPPGRPPLISRDEIARRSACSRFLDWLNRR